ncbi:MAG TPA: MFS transporter [Burkholderiaceae bacterium]|jgi:predicted MFS family arabinose efflux permease|nr:MFS transporter [Burkholderiaceae bacterium]
MSSSTAAPSAPPSARSEGLVLLTLAGIQFTHILDFMIIMPLGPQLIRLLNINTHEFGLLLSSYTFTAAASGLLAATYIDRFDRRKLILTIYGLFMLATLACGLAPNYATLLIARALAGAFGGVLGALVQTMVADLIPFERRGQAMGTIMTAFSLSTVAGVPLGLLLANHLPSIGWRAPFFFIVLLSAMFFFIAYKLLPSLTSHMIRPAQGTQGNIFKQIYAVAKVGNHLKAFAFVSLLMMAGFTVVPYIALYTTSNLGLPESFLTIIYLCGGAATFFTSRAIGRMADKYGKQQAFIWITFASFIPLLITTHLVPVPWWVVLINSTVFFILVPGRMIPGMALLTAAASSQVRGTFMSLVSSVQMLASGLASLIAGLIITRTAGGQIEHFNIVGYIAVACGLLAIWLVRQLKVTPAEIAAPAPGKMPV